MSNAGHPFIAPLTRANVLRSALSSDSGSDQTRPASVSSSVSGQSNRSTQMLHGRRGRGKGRESASDNAVYIGEELKIAIDIALERFRLSEDQSVLEFPSSLTSNERAYIHRLCQSLGLKSKSKGSKANRQLTVCKKDEVRSLHSAAVSTFSLVRGSRHQIQSLLQRFPVTNKERQELHPRTERSQLNEARSMSLNKATTGRLNNGVPQVPPAPLSTAFHEFRSSLPVSTMKDAIISTINSNQISLIAGETGSGKTTQVPQMILEECHAEGKPCRILCTQPRRISVLRVAERVATERGEKIGQAVGYQIRLESRVSPKTLLTFCTNGVLLRTLMGGDQSLNTVTHIIVDEIHERDRFSDFLLIVLRELVSKWRHLRIVLMSASLNTQLFIDYFGSCQILSVPGRTFNVKEYFLEEILKWTNYENKKMVQYKKELRKFEAQSKQLTGWYEHVQEQEADDVELEDDDDDDEKPLPDDGATGSPSDSFLHGHQFSALNFNDTRSISELGPEKEELEPWLIKKIDDLITEVWFSGNAEQFTQIFNLILTEGVSVDYHHSETSATPLMIAAGRGFFTVCEQLLNLGANIGVRASNGWTAVEWAKRFNRTDICELFEANLLEIEPTIQEMDLNETGLQPVMTPALSQQDVDLLNVYNQSFNDQNVDVKLVICVLLKIHNSLPEGAILVFLPGYADIVAVRDEVLNKFKNQKKYILYTLHSNMQSTDQKRIFKRPPQGVRKIILSTNISETGLTIDDVVYVIDCGKVKVKSFDALSSVTMLRAEWISKASAIQRSGRAGRCQNGFCYRLYSSLRFHNMQPFPEPELLRYPLQELCLHTKLLAPNNCQIVDFLAKAPEPPAFLITCNAVHLLKQIDALDTFEEMTELGHHLADLPVEPRYAKMILYSVVLKCLDPVLTIACTLAYKDPFILPPQPHEKRAVSAARRKFAAGTFSDHMTLLRAFQGWQKARADGFEDSFCEKNYLSRAVMEMIVGMRTQLLGQLRASGFVRARGGGDIRDLNTNSESWAVVKAALCAGMYPNIIHVDRDKLRLSTNKQDKVRIHTSSVLNAGPSKLGNGTAVTSSTKGAEALKYLPTDWMLYEEITRAHRFVQVRCCTVLSPTTVCVFAGPAKLPLDYVREAEYAAQGGDGDGPIESSTDSESEEKDETRRATFKIDDWIQFKLDPEAANLMMQLRLKWHSLFLRRMRAPSKPWTTVDETVIRIMITLLTSEEHALGLQQPAGIGQRPRPMSTESNVTTNEESLRDMYLDVHQETDDAPSLISPVDPGTHGNFPLDVENSGETAEACSSDSPSPPANTPASPTTLESSGRPSPHPCRFFIIKCSNQRIFDNAVLNSVCQLAPRTEKKVNQAHKEGRLVYLIFSVHCSGQFQGYARAMPQLNESHSSDNSGLNSGVITLEWARRGNLPFQQTHHLINPWNENKRVQASKDGQEIEPKVGESLVKMWDRHPYQPLSSQGLNQRPQGLTPLASGYSGHHPSSDLLNLQYASQQQQQAASSLTSPQRKPSQAGKSAFTLPRAVSPGWTGNVHPFHTINPYAQNPAAAAATWEGSQSPGPRNYHTSQPRAFAFQNKTSPRFVGQFGNNGSKYSNLAQQENVGNQGSGGPHQRINTMNQAFNSSYQIPTTKNNQVFNIDEKTSPTHPQVMILQRKNGDSKFQDVKK